MKSQQQNITTYLAYLLTLYRIVTNPIFNHEICSKALFAILILLAKDDTTDTILGNVPYAMLAISQPSVEELTHYNRFINGPLENPYLALLDATKVQSINPKLNELIETLITELIEGYPDQFEQIINSAYELLQRDTNPDESKAVNLAFLTTRLEAIVKSNSKINPNQKIRMIAAIQTFKQATIPSSTHTLSTKEEPSRSIPVH